MEEDIDRETLDKLVDVLSKPQGSDSIEKVKSALYARMDRLSATIQSAQSEGSATYKAYRAMGGGNLKGFERSFGVAVEGEVIPAETPALPEPQVRSVGVRTRTKYHRKYRSLSIDPGEVATFMKLVQDEYGRPPSYKAIADYFEVSRGSIGKHIARAVKEHGAPRHLFGQHTPEGFDRKVARRFGTYLQPKPQE